MLEAIDRLDVGSLLGGSKLSESIRDLKQRRAMLADRMRREDTEAINVLGAIKEGGAGSMLLAAELAKLEASLTGTRNEINSIGREIDDLSRIDPDKRKTQVRSLMAYMESAAGEALAEKRRALAGELQRLLRKVVVIPRHHVAWELMEEYPDWSQRYDVESKIELERICKERCYELLLIYRTGDTLQVDAMDGEVFRTKKSVRMKSMEFVGRQGDRPQSKVDIG